MRTAILSLITAAALLATTSTADARPFRHWGGYRGYNNGVRFFRSYNTSPYYNYRSWGYPGYYSYGYPGYYGNYYGNYYNPGFYLNFGGLSIGSGYGYGYPYYGGWWW
jgi:hypothetical protein